MAEFSRYVIYADESGDHSLSRIDVQYPVFVLCLCVFNKKHYMRRIVPAVQGLKFKWFGHDTCILHEREIRKKAPPFEFLNDPNSNSEFLDDLGHILQRASMLVVAAVVDKRRLKDEHLFHDNPYHLALGFCIERVYEFLKRRSEAEKIVHFVFERRGEREDKDLELEFRRITAGQNRFSLKLPNFEIRLVDKKANATGMQVADLMARPIGLSVFKSKQPNRAFEMIRRKLVSGAGTKRGMGPIRVLP